MITPDFIILIVLGRLAMVRACNLRAWRPRQTQGFEVNLLYILTQK